MLGEGAARSQFRGMVGVIAFSLFLDYFLYGIFLSLATHSPAKVHSEQQLAWLYGAYAMSALVLTPLFGYLGNRVRSRSIILYGVALAGCAAAFFSLESNFSILLLARLCQGAASAALWTAGLALIAAHYLEKRAEMIGYAFTGSTAGSVLGPIAGAFLFHIGGYRLPFLITGALLLVDACLVVVILPRERRGQEKALRASLLLNRSLAVPALAIALSAFAVGIVEPLLPVRLARFGTTSKATGIIFTISTIVYGLSAPIVGKISERFSNNKVSVLGTVAMAVTLPLLAVVRQTGLVCLAVALLYVAYAFILNPASAELGDVVDRAGMSCYSTVYAVYNVVYSVGMLATAALASIAAHLLGFLGVLLCISAVLLACIPFLTSTKSRVKSIPEAVTGQRC